MGSWRIDSHACSKFLNTSLQTLWTTFIQLLSFSTTKIFNKNWGKMIIFQWIFHLFTFNKVPQFVVINFHFMLFLPTFTSSQIHEISISMFMELFSHNFFRENNFPPLQISFSRLCLPFSNRKSSAPNFHLPPFIPMRVQIDIKFEWQRKAFTTVLPACYSSMRLNYQVNLKRIDLLKLRGETTNFHSSVVVRDG
jgi:hypothetical protein